jgi:hypothetical protein
MASGLSWPEAMVLEPVHVAPSGHVPMIPALVSFVQ